MSAPSDLRSAFWVTVAAANVALLSGSLALMLAYFRGAWAWTAALGAVAVVAARRAVRGYREGKRLSVEDG